MKLQVVVNKLNRRKSPVTDFANKSNVVDVVKSGFVFESVAQIENQLGVWHQDSDGLWASEKWLSSSLAVNVAQYMNDRFDGTNIKELVDYNFLLNIPQELKSTNGKDSIIGILDQPISTNIPFASIIRPLAINTAESPDGHANFISGFIAANTENFKGICSSATVLELPLFDKDGFSITSDDFDKLINSIKSFDKPVIINVSRTHLFFEQHEMAQLQSLSNVIFVCSAGTDGQLNDIGANGCFILDNPNTITISVGCVSNNFMAGGNQAFQFDKELDVIFPILPYVSFKSNGKSFDQESDVTCSYATGIVTAIISLLFSAGVLKSGSDKTEIVNAIKTNSQKYAAGNSFLNPTIL